ncbi:MAG: Asp-tRNA(Asn)/Glu-tRNA(Gln) amidotransferase subunit GatA [Crocinitomicaceae bacterium]|nr:Asp-tRNA(Asn)/Glu-tRNA(Gln) amidotransferase subunit GatA [Crocinitomicaceae bacterium]
MYRTFAEIKAAIANGTTVEDITRYYLDQIEASKHLNAFLEVFTDDALAQAKVVDQKLTNGTAGRLAGMVIALKDNIVYQGHKVSASSKILENFESLFSATATERLLAEDAVIIGRTNCDEFAMGSSNENSAFGNVLNPINEKMVPGGSSGGSAVAVAANLCTASLGSDTGGSIRQPASFTGTVGLKPTYGRISRHGLIAYASSFDQIGPFTNNVEDAALLLEIMAGKDEFDSTVLQQDTENFLPAFKTDKKLKIAYLRDGVESEGNDPEVKARMRDLIEKLRAAGHTVEGVDFPFLEVMVPTYYVLTTAEASSNLARFDGVHYGYQSPKVEGVDNTYKKSRSEGFGEEVQRRIMLGTFVLSHGYYDAYYTKGQKVRRIIQNKTKEILDQYSFIILPTTPTTAFEIGQNIDDPITMYLQDIFTVQANLAGNPAISLPMGNHSNGLPFGIQVMGKHYAEGNLLAFSDYLMKHYN